MKWRILAPLCLGLTLTGASFAQSPDVVKIGVLNDQNGPYADFGGATSVEAARMAIEDFGGTVLNKKIELVAADHQNKPDVAAEISRRWFDIEGVTAVTDLTNSAVALAVQNIARDKNRITLAVGPATLRLTNEDCSPTGFHWAFDTYSQAVGTARAILAQGGDTWFILAADYAFGHQMAADLTRIVTGANGKVLGEVRHPLNSSDFSSFLLQAQSSKAKIIGLANAGADTVNSVKQAAEFQIAAGGQKLAGLVVVISDVHALSLKVANGLTFTTAFYWDLNDQTRAWSKRFYERTKRMPGMVQAGTYSSVLHYLKAVKAANTTDAKAVADKMREIKVDDFFAKGFVRGDGRMVHDMYLVEVKKPEESKAPWDYYKVLRTIAANDATLPLADSKCKLVNK